MKAAVLTVLYTEQVTHIKKISFCEQDMKNDGNSKQRIVLRMILKEPLHGWMLIGEARVSRATCFYDTCHKHKALIRITL